MKLRNKKTGEIVDLYEGIIRDDGEHITIKPVAVLEKCYIYNSLAELNAEWEDYDEPKEYWYINASGDVSSICEDEENPEDTKVCKEIGNYFSSREEAEQAVEKLKAWKRLKDNSFRFVDLRFEYDELGGTIKFKTNLCDGINDDLDLLFGGEK